VCDLGRAVLAIPIVSIAVPLLCILIAIVLSPWFNIVNNALSDLGHATRSFAAPVFNFGLSLGGALIIVTAVVLIARVSKALATVMWLAGYALILVAVFDEVYGRLHFWVSIAFFISLALALIIYSIIMKSVARKILALVLLIVAAVSWILHLYYGIPPGAAVPELISIFIAIPFYMDAALQSTREQH
jgi:hypothetical membrane protein